LKEELTLVWVELGRNIPRYLKRNIKLHRRLYPNSNLVLVTDRQYEDSNLSEVFNLNDRSKSPLYKQFLAINKVWVSHQRDFWINTTERFFALYDYLLEAGSYSIVHLESDVILLDKESTIAVCSEVRKRKKIAFPMYNDSLGSPGILFVPSYDSLGHFLTHVIKRWSLEGETDMSLLKGYSSKGITLSNGFDFQPQLNSSRLPGIWDGGRLGQYFLGIDARNVRLPFSLRYQRKYLSRGGRNGLGVIRFSFVNFSVVFINQKQGNLATIHVHNKMIPSTRIGLYVQLVIGFSVGERLRPFSRYRFDSVVFFERFLGFIKRRLFGDRSEVNLR